ncbi:two-component system, NarL family, sensor histidine kinase UhpB [Paracoccus aminovorans]|uniref:histidine kinase n=1 Tax=Paracoccus aminovorans TaxID=34004 RepID=A0A1I2YIT7_9RHOB|nr:LapD/MoxY N-terminal periplasmic domain-containing protein [Paracoccus aminovorans]CQR86716.1 integral membrane sensor signal transduction histidine kinase [Paracoccus aminovorans]SFH25555.1 two-component system, NarL family, sensor histidine kinase UhpB [Paracoccus aminovorans]
MDATGQIAAGRQAADAHPRPHGVSLRLLALGGAALVWLAIFAIIASVLLLNARSAVREETLSAFRLASAFATMRLPTDFERRDMMAEARSIAADIESQRHVAAELRDARGRPVALPPAPAAPPEAAPRWFAALLAPQPQSDLIPVTQYPNVLGVLEIRTDPQDEIAEAWADVRLILPLMAATALAAIGVTMAVTALVLRRLGLLGAALARMRAGDLAVRAPQTGLTELAHLSDGVNALASHLADERARNRSLQGRMMALAEAERARIASDLHDGIGPQLFALQAAVAQAGQRAAPLDDPPLAAALDAVSRHAGAIRDSARAAIDDLRLAPAEGASLAEMLQELAIEFTEIAPGVEIALDTPPALPEPDEAGRIALYRFVRESVLNALRHAQPTRVRVTLAQAGGALLAQVEDDGPGPAAAGSAGAGRKGLGQAGMRDRASALGGRYLPPRREGAVTVTEFRLPDAGPTDQGLDR